MELDRDGARLIRHALDEPELIALESALSALPSDRAGVRIAGCPQLRPMLAVGGRIGRIAAGLLGEGCRPVRAILFDKSERANWALGWHQDRTIAVARKVEAAGFGPWSTKAGVPHVEPPVALLEAMVTLRVHLDPVDADNAPLLIAPRSHRFGRIPEDRLDTIVELCGTEQCLADRGDVWAYATLVVHASKAAARPRRRRVLQVDYCAADLPAGLDFYGV